MLFHQLWPDSLLDAKLPQLFTLAKERRPWVCGFQPFLGGHLLRYWDVLWKKWIQNQQCVILEACPNKPNTYSILIIVLGIGVKEPRPTFSRTIAVGLSMSHFSSPKKKLLLGDLQAEWLELAMNMAAMLVRYVPSQQSVADCTRYTDYTVSPWYGCFFNRHLWQTFRLCLMNSPNLVCPYLSQQTYVLSFFVSSSAVSIGCRLPSYGFSPPKKKPPKAV